MDRPPVDRSKLRPSSQRLGCVLPTRRIFEVALVVAILARPAFGLVHLWAAKTLGTQQPGSLAHGVAEVVTVIV